MALCWRQSRSIRLGCFIRLPEAAGLPLKNDLGAVDYMTVPWDVV
jgi:hypothetical protein